MSERLDVAMVAKGLAQSREKARALIMAGVVYVEGARADKAGMPVGDAASIEVRENPIPFVSRGGLKLQKALEVFPIRLEGVTAADIGASTGGFTDCMLQHGAKHVYSIDVGYGQLAWKLRTDERVVNLERTNFRYVTREAVPDEIDFASVDVSFISLKLIVPVMRGLLGENAEAVCLIKPQFEAGKDKVGKKGVVREIETHIEVVRNIKEFVLENGFSVLNLDFSPIKGPQGNIEYLIYIKNDGLSRDMLLSSVEEIVERSHSALGGAV